MNGDVTVIRDYWNLVSWLDGKLGAEGTAAGLLILGGAVLCILLPYLIGSINPAIILSKLVYHDDIRTHGSGNAGTTNMLRTYGKGAAVATLLLDFSKAIIATLLGRLIFGENGQALAGFFVGFGHMFPIYYRFRGGKGVACFGMVALVISPWAFLGILATFVIVVIGTRYISLASVMAALMYPLFINAFASDKAGAVAMGVGAAVMVIFMHRENLKRLWRNEESKLDFSKFKSKKKQATKDEKADFEVTNPPKSADPNEASDESDETHND